MNDYVENTQSTIKRIRGDIYNLLEILEMSILTPFELNKIQDIMDKLKGSITDLRIEVGRKF